MKSSTFRVCALLAVLLGLGVGTTAARAETVELAPDELDGATADGVPMPRLISDELSDEWQKDGKQKCAPYCCVGCCCDDPCDCWSVYGGLLVLHRSDPNDAVLFSNALNPAQNFNANQFDFGFQAGYEVGVIRHNILPCHVCGLDLQAGFFSIDGWSDTQTFSTTAPPTPVFTQIHSNPPAFFNGARDVTSTYDSRLSGFELNLLKRSAIMPRVKWLAGFRAFELDEQLYSEFADGDPAPQDEPTGVYQIQTRNRLYGFQAGAFVDLINRCCWCLRGFGKFGIYGNETGHDSLLLCCLDPNVPQVGLPINETASQVAGSAELGLSFKYCWNECWSLRADYRLLWLDGVALASDQVAVSNFNPVNPDGSGSGIDTNGSVFYHGLFVGLQRTW